MTGYGYYGTKYHMQLKKTCVSTFYHVCETIKIMLGGKARRDSQIKLQAYKVMVDPALIYGSETRVMTKSDQNQIKQAFF